MVKIDLIGPFYKSLIPEFQIAFKARENVELYIDSEGGKKKHCVEAMAAIRYMIKEGLTVDALVVGEAKSSAFMVLQVCSIRQALASATFMFHPPAVLRFGKVGEPAFVDDRSNTTDPVYVVFLEELSARCGIDIPQLEKWGIEERVFTAEEALEFGFIDKIVETPPQS